MEFATRLCRPGDEKALSLVAQATILETYAGITDDDDLLSYLTSALSVADFTRILVSDRMRVWIAETTAGKCPVGYALAVSDEHAQSFSSFELKRLYLFHRFHGSGLGKRLMQEVLSFARYMNSETIWLQVHEANTHAIEFYKRFGFLQTGADLFRAKSNFRAPDIVPRKPVRFLEFKGRLQPSSAFAVRFRETRCWSGSAPCKESAERASDVAN